MGWEQRSRGGSYYVRKRRIGRRVVSEYVGTGEQATHTALLAELLRSEVQEARQQEQAQRQQEQAADRQIAEALALVKDLADTAYLLGGYHAHKRQWRKRRDDDHDR